MNEAPASPVPCCEGQPTAQATARPEATEPLLVARGIRKVYQDADRQIEVLKGVDLAIEPNRILAIIGASGVGKSTLLHILGLLERPSSGELRYQGRDPTKLGDWERSAIRAKEFGFVFQMFHLLPDLDAQENAMLPALMGSGPFGRQMPRRAARKRSEEILARLGLGDRLRHRPSQLSGGEKQRVAIARALMNQPRIVFCDEPTGNLDPKTGEELFRLLLDLNRENQQTFVLITHEPSLAARAHAVFRMEDGRLAPAHQSAADGRPEAEHGESPAP